MTEQTPFRKIADGLLEAYDFVQKIQKDFQIPTSEISKTGRIEVWSNGALYDKNFFDSSDVEDMGVCLKWALDTRGALLSEYPSAKVQLKIKGAK